MVLELKSSRTFQSLLLSVTLFAYPAVYVPFWRWKTSGDFLPDCQWLSVSHSTHHLVRSENSLRKCFCLSFLTHEPFPHFLAIPSFLWQPRWKNSRCNGRPELAKPIQLVLFLLWALAVQRCAQGNEKQTLSAEVIAPHTGSLLQEAVYLRFAEPSSSLPAVGMYWETTGPEETMFHRQFQAGTVYLHHTSCSLRVWGGNCSSAHSQTSPSMQYICLLKGA